MDFIFLCFCTVIDNITALNYVSCVLFCSSHAMTSSVIYYSTDACKNEIYLLNIKACALSLSKNSCYSKCQTSLSFSSGSSLAMEDRLSGEISVPRNPIPHPKLCGVFFINLSWVLFFQNQVMINICTYKKHTTAR